MLPARPRGFAQSKGAAWHSPGGSFCQAPARLAAGAIVAAPLEQAAGRITKDPQGYWFHEADTKVLFYSPSQRKVLPDGQAARSNYFHPLYDLDGTRPPY